MRRHDQLLCDLVGPFGAEIPAHDVQAQALSPLTGWLGHAKPFDFDDRYAPAPGIARFLCGSHPVMGMAALEEGIDLMLEADPAAMFAKSRALCALFIDVMEARCAGFGLDLASPRDPGARGSHVSYRHPQGYAIMQNLIANGVVGDFRAPDIMRFGFAPLYVGYADVWRAVDVLAGILAAESWRDPVFHKRHKVT